MSHKVCSQRFCGTAVRRVASPAHDHLTAHPHPFETRRRYQSSRNMYDSRGAPLVKHSFAGVASRALRRRCRTVRTGIAVASEVSRTRG